jgi:glycine/D-amino acid oxidase-like deaminating enzyme
MIPEVDAVIVGGGIVGCTAAYHLARRGLRPLVLEQRTVAAQQSGRSFGFVRQQGRDPLELPLAIESNRLWRNLRDDLGVDAGWVQGGILTLAATESRMAEFEAWLGIARAHGLDTRLLRLGDVEDIVPGIRGTWAGALYTPSDGRADPRKATEALALAATSRGARVTTGCCVRSILTRGGAVTGVMTDRGEIRTSRVLCAAGAWSARLARTVGLTVPLRLVRSTVALTAPVPTLTPTGVWAPGVAFWQHADGRLNLSGGSAADHDLALDSLRHLQLFLPSYWENRSLFRFHVGRRLAHDLGRLWPASARRRDARIYERDADPPPNLARVRSGVEELRHLLPRVGEVDIERSWAGYFDVTPDALPILGATPAPSGLVVATGFCGRGLALGPVVGRVAAELLTGEVPSVELRVFDPTRFMTARTRKAPKPL